MGRFFAGVMSACFAFGIELGDPLQKLAVEHGAQEINANNAPLLLVLTGGGIANIVAYAEFIFFGMGETPMGKFSVLASWPIHMAFIILFSNMWGILLHEWKGTSRRTWVLLTIGLAALVVSTVISSYGSWLKEHQQSPAAATNNDRIIFEQESAEKTEFVILTEGT